jgi:hypothetical protein
MASKTESIFVTPAAARKAYIIFLHAVAIAVAAAQIVLSLGVISARGRCDTTSQLRHNPSPRRSHWRRRSPDCIEPRRNSVQRLCDTTSPLQLHSFPRRMAHPIQIGIGHRHFLLCRGLRPAMSGRPLQIILPRSSCYLLPET